MLRVIGAIVLTIGSFTAGAVSVPQYVPAQITGVEIDQAMVCWRETNNVTGGWDKYCEVR